ncbi:MAG: hypothetical protein QUS09_05195, partial [Methanotrichaceae archaeon]|nr:hypothetical protein [Methanotrichaceae archaeon]
RRPPISTRFGTRRQRLMCIRDSLTGLRKLQVRTIVLEDAKPPVVGLHQSRGFGGDKNGPNVDIDQSGVSYEDESNFRVWGTVVDVSSGAPTNRDQAYESAASPWFATPVQAHVGHTKGDWMKWLVYMPSARVTGTLSWDNQTRIVEAVGYHDHSWGRWAFNDPQWNWVQVSAPEDGFAMVLGDAIGEQRNTLLGIRYAGDELKFSGKQVAMNYTDFSLDQLTSRIYPVAYEIEADNGDYELEANVSVIRNVPLCINYPAPMPSYVIFEQVALFNGTLRSQEGETYQFEEMGFAQYTTHRLHPIYGRVNATDSESIDITITATNERTGQTKVAEPSSEGSFSFDASYADYLANSTAPWVADGDIVKVEAKDAAGRQGNNTITIDMAEDGQEIEVTA